MALLSLIFAMPAVLHAQLDVESGTIDVDLIVEGCNNNLVCEAIIGEDTLTCPVDCPEPAPTPTVTPTVSDTSPRQSNRRFIETETGPVEEIQTGADDIRVEQFTVEPQVVSATFLFTTNTYTIASVRVGETSSYELRAVAEFGYRRTHELFVSGLQPSTSYEYEVLVADLRGNIVRLRGTFTTKSSLTVPSIAKPLLAKPSNIKVRISEEGIATATWENPIQQSFSYTQVVRTTDAPAKKPSDGITVYTGEATTFTDTGVVPDATYYYTFFSNHGGELFADSVFVAARYSTASEALPELIDFKPQFGDETFSVFDFSFTQNGNELTWGNRELTAAPYEPITLRFKKPNFFGPLEDVYVDVIAYNSAGEVTDRRFQKFVFRTELYAYQTILDGFEQDQTLLVTLTVFRADGTFDRVLSKINVGKYSSFETSSDNVWVSCRGIATGLEHIKNLIMCTMPWPFILLTALLAVLMRYVRKILLKEV